MVSIVDVAGVDHGFILTAPLVDALDLKKSGAKLERVRGLPDELVSAKTLVLDAARVPSSRASSGEGAAGELRRPRVRRRGQDQLRRLTAAHVAAADEAALQGPPVFKSSKDELAFGVVPAFRRYELYQARYSELVPVVAQALAEKGPALQVLDLGPGTGEAKKFVDALAGPARWTAVEVTPRYVEACRQLGYERIVEGVDLERDPLPLPDASFDVVIASHILEHLQNAPDALRDWLRVVRPGGHLLIGVPMHFGWLAALARLKYRLFGRRPRQHCLFFSMRTLRAFFDGFEVRRVWGFRLFSARQWLPFEDWKWFYELSRWLGERAPSLTGEVIVHVVKPR